MKFWKKRKKQREEAVHSLTDLNPEVLEYMVDRVIHPTYDAAHSMSHYFINQYKINLDNKMDYLMDWIKTNIDSKDETRERIKNLINKFVGFFECKYPDDIFDKDMLDLINRQKEDHLSFKEYGKKSNTHYDETLLDKLSFHKDISAMTYHFLHVYLTESELKYLTYPKYYNIKKQLFTDGRSARLELDDDGYVKKAEGFNFLLWHTGDINQQLCGKHLKDIIDLFKENGTHTRSSGLEKIVNNIETQRQLRQNILDCILYQLIKKGGKIIGPRRAYLFAREIDSDPYLAFAYGYDTTDPNFKEFLRIYLEDGGQEDLVCYQNYFISMDTPVKEVAIKELVAKYFGTREQLYQRFGHVLLNQIDHKEVEKEKYKQYRIKRKIARSKNR